MTCITLNGSIVPRALRGSVSVDRVGLPRFWPSWWIHTSRAKLSRSSNNAATASIDRLYATAWDLGCADLDESLWALDFDTISRILNAHIARLNNRSRQQKISQSRAWNHCRAFISDVLRTIGAAEHGRWHEITASLARLEEAYGKLKSWEPESASPVRALPSLVIAELYEIFDPRSARNPFRTAPSKWRNFLIFLILLHLGLRRAELLLLTLDAFRSEYDFSRQADVNWLIVADLPRGCVGEFDEEDDWEPDPRLITPDLKNKMARRVIPVSEELLRAKETYEGGFRRTCEWPHLITSQKRRPLSVRQLNNVFEVATSALSIDASKALEIRGKETVTPHDLRHTSAVRRLGGFLAKGYSRAVAEQKLRVLFGWGPESLMPLVYANAYYETDAATIWEDKYDSYVDAVRQLEGVQ